METFFAYVLLTILVVGSFALFAPRVSAAIDRRYPDGVPFSVHLKFDFCVELVLLTVAYIEYKYRPDFLRVGDPLPDWALVVFVCFYPVLAACLYYYTYIYIPRRLLELQAQSECLDAQDALKNTPAPTPPPAPSLQQEIAELLKKNREAE